MAIPNFSRLGVAKRIAAVAALCLATAAGSPSDEGTISGTAVDGQVFSWSDERGHVVLVNFWASWCAPCRAEMPAMDAFYRKHHDDGFDMVAISLDSALSKQMLARATSRFSFPVARIADMSALPRSAPSTLPVTWVYARDGSIRYGSAMHGKKTIDTDTLDAIVEPLLAKRPTGNHEQQRFE